MCMQPTFDKAHRGIGTKQYHVDDHLAKTGQNIPESEAVVTRKSIVTYVTAVTSAPKISDRLEK